MTDWQPELRLWQAVINQALHDAFSNAWREELHKREALSFLLEKSGNWKQSRDIISDVCGYAPEYLYEKTIKMMTGKSKSHMRHRAYPDKIKR